jgi:prepilin-type N-terminal cleavage/methylation domain-containing protein
MALFMKRERGLTLVELVVTIAIVAVLAAAMIPSLGRWVSHYRIRGAARDVASCFRLAQMTAIQQNRNCAVQFDLSGNCSVLVTGTANPLRRVVPDTDYPGVHLDLSQGGGDGLEFPDTVPAGGDGLYSITFNSRGIPSDENGQLAAAERIYLENARNEGYWVEVSPVGNVRYDKYRDG